MSGNVQKLENVKLSTAIHRSDHARQMAEAKQIIDDIEAAHQLKPGAIYKRVRHPRIVRARQEAMHILREDLYMELPQIARLFGGINHTTVIYGVRRHAERKAQEKKNGGC